MCLSCFFSVRLFLIILLIVVSRQVDGAVYVCELCQKYEKASLEASGRGNCESGLSPQIINGEDDFFSHSQGKMHVVSVELLNP